MPRPFLRFSWPIAAALALQIGSVRAASDPLAPPADATYLRPDGSIYVAGNDLLADFLQEISDRFTKLHPEIHFTMDLHASSLAMSGLASGKSAFGPMARDATASDQSAFTARFGYAPTDVIIGWDNTPDAEHFPPSGKHPPAVWVNVRNPIPALKLSELAAILTTGTDMGDITHWGQISGDEAAVGANGADWAKRQIHVYLPSPHGLPVLSTTRLRLGGHPWTAHAEFLPSMEDVMNAVAEDPFGIGFVGWWPIDEGWDRQVELGPKVRIMPLAFTDDGPIGHGIAGELYPTAGALHIYLNRQPGHPLDAWLAALVQMMLSPEGQGILAAHAQDWGFIPLDKAAIPAELAKIAH